MQKFAPKNQIKIHMKKAKIFQILIVAGMVQYSYSQNTPKSENPKTAHHEIANSKASPNTPDEALAELKNGNKRFLNGKLINTNYKKDIEHTKGDQHPHSLILSCLDSRIPPEIIFDQGIGNIFVARVAGNIEDANILGSMEFATKVKGTKLIVVMGHNNCGAVKGAIDNAELGNLTQLVSQIKPAITGDKSNMEDMINETAKRNVKLTIDDILNQSNIINELVTSGKVKIVGAYYDLNSGKVSFIN